MADDAGAVYGELVEQLDDSFCVSARVHWPRQGAIASAVAQQIENDEPMTRRHEGNHAVPEMARGREAVDEYDRHTGTTRSGGEVVEPCAGKIEKLTAHA